MYHLHLAWLFLLTWFANRTHPSASHRERKILILTSGKLGDLVCMTSLYGAIHRQLGSAVDVVANHFGPELYVDNPHLRKVFMFGQVLPVRLRAEHYSHAVVLNPNPELVALAVQAHIPYRISITSPRENFWTYAFERFVQERHVYRFDQQVAKFYQTMLATLGLKPEPERRELFPSATDRQRAQEFWQTHQFTGKFVAAMFLGAGKAYKLWPVERFAAVADYLVKKHRAKILLVGSPSDKERTMALATSVKHHEAIVDATGQFKLLGLAAVLAPCRLFIAVDTGPLYIADTMGVPVVNIAGPVDTITQHPIGQNRIVYPAVEQRIGTRAVAFHSGSENTDRYRQMTEAISIEQVTTAIDELVGETLQATS